MARLQLFCSFNINCTVSIYVYLSPQRTKSLYEVIGKGIIIVEQEVEVEEPVEEVVEIKDFYMEVNGGTCSYCVNWAYVGDEYHLQIETYDEQHGKYIDGVEITAKIISKGGELRHDFGEVTTEDGIYRNSIIIPSMDWYAGNILSVTGEYYGVEKTIEKEFEVLKKSGSNNRAGESAGSCAHVSQFSIYINAQNPEGITFSKSGEKMFVSGDKSNVITEYTLTGAYCINTASFVSSLDVGSLDPRGVAFDRSGERMFVVGKINTNITEYILSEAWDVSSATSVDSLNVNSQDTDPKGIAFSKSGHKMFIVGNAGDDINEYTFPANGTVSSASFVDSFSVASQEENPRGIAFSKSGEKMFIAGDSGNDINEYKLDVAWDVSSASFVDSFSVNSQEAAVRDVWFDSSGKTMFIVGKSGDDVNVYKLTTAWDVSTASFTG